MKFFIFILLFNYLFSLNYSYNDSIICISDNSIEIERAMQVCDYCESFKTDNGTISKDDCKDYKIISHEKLQKTYKIKFVSKIKTIQNYLYFQNTNNNYKISIKYELKKKFLYSKRILYNQILKQIKSTVIIS